MHGGALPRARALSRRAPGASRQRGPAAAAARQGMSSSKIGVLHGAAALAGAKAGVEASSALDAARWQSWRSQIAFSIFDTFAAAAIRTGKLTLHLPDGSRREYGSETSAQSAVPDAPAWRGLPPRSAAVTVKSGDFFFKIVLRHDSGLGDAYMAGDFVVDDLGALLAVLTANARHIESARGLLGVLNAAGGAALHVAHLARPNTVEGSRRCAARAPAWSARVLEGGACLGRRASRR